MKQSHSWETNSSSGNQESRYLLWNLKVNCLVHKSPPLVPVLSYANSVLTVPPYFSKIPSNIILHLSLVLPTGFSFQIFRQKLCMQVSFVVCVLRVPPILPLWFDDIRWKVRVMNHLINQFTLASCYISLFISKYSSQHPVLQHLCYNLFHEYGTKFHIHTEQVILCFF